MFDKSTYIERRQKLKKQLKSGLLLFMGNDEQGLNYEDNAYNYRQDSTFLYFFGLSRWGLMAVIDIDNDRDIIFGDELTIDDIVWMGVQPTLHEKAYFAGVEDVRPLDDLHKYISEARKAGREVLYLPTYRAEHKIKLWKLLDVMPGNEKPSVDFIKAVVNQRNYKSEEEIVEIERACNVTADMHIAAIRHLRPDMRECEVAAVIEAVAQSNDCTLSFPTICTINGQTLHNHFHGNIAPSGRLMLIDAGAEVDSGYAGDMSSTFPVDSKFTDRQRLIYDVQVMMHRESVKALRPGITFKEVYELSARVMVDNLKSLGLFKGSTDDIIETGAFAICYPHGLGHMMGLDVHDMENLGEIYVGYDGAPKSTQFGKKSLRLARKLEPGFVHTIEPGIYFIPELIDKWRNEKKFTDFINYDEFDKWSDFGGVRNEEDYLITADGARRLGKKIPLTAEEVEAERG